MVQVVLFLVVFLSGIAHAQPVVEDGEWPVYARTPEGTRYSPLSQITAENVADLERVWVYRTGDIAPKGPHYSQCTPLMINNTLYVITTLSRAVALDATTGESLWEFSPDPALELRETGGGGLASRGVAYWTDGEIERIFLPVRDGRLYSLDAKTGLPDTDFGSNGKIDIRSRIPGDGRYLFLSSPPVIFGDYVIQGCGINDTSGQKMPHVPVFAFNVRNGIEEWTFNTVPQEGEWGTHTWDDDSWFNRGGTNVWSIMSVDPALGLIYLPVSAPNYDFYGGDRHGENLYSCAVVALDGEHGEPVWHYQTIMHDVWDYDLAAQPLLVDITVDGERIPALAQVGKTGFVYVLNRKTGEPVFPIEERPVPDTDIPGEEVWPTQPFPVKPPALVRQHLTADDINDRDEESQAYLMDWFSRLRSEGIFTPITFEGTVIFPGLHGGGNWSGASASPDGMMYVNVTELPYIGYMKHHRPNGPFRYYASHRQFRDEEGYPGIKPPWGKLVKVDLNEGEILWEKPLGEHPELTAKGIPVTGQENFGGSTVTAGGVVFIAATRDEMIRAFDVETGEILFQHKMEAAGYAAPVTYVGSDGRQYVTIVAGGGGKYGTGRGDYIISFALPE